MALYRVRTVLSGPSGAPWLNTFYFDDASGTAQQAATAAGAFWSGCNTYLSTGVTWTTEADVVVIDPASGQATGAFSTTPVTGGGLDSGVLLPRSSQALVRWFTGVFNNGRQIRGRTFIPGLCQGSTAAGGVLATGPKTAFTTAATNLVNATNAELSVYSRSKAREDTVTGSSVWAQFAVLRSRRD